MSILENWFRSVLSQLLIPFVAQQYQQVTVEIFQVVEFEMVPGNKNLPDFSNFHKVDLEHNLIDRLFELGFFSELF